MTKTVLLWERNKEESSVYKLRVEKAEYIRNANIL